jgi:hypothetical protein
VRACRLEHALARQHLAGSDLVRAPVLHEPDVMAVLAQPDGKQQARLSATDNRDVTHASLPIKTTERQ